MANEADWHRYSDDDRRIQLNELAALCRSLAADLRAHGETWPASLFDERAALAERLLQEGWDQSQLNELGARFPTGVEWLNPKALDFSGPRERWQASIAETHERAAHLAMELRAIATAD